MFLIVETWASFVPGALHHATLERRLHPSTSSTTIRTIPAFSPRTRDQAPSRTTSLAENASQLASRPPPPTRCELFIPFQGWRFPLKITVSVYTFQRKSASLKRGRSFTSCCWWPCLCLEHRRGLKVPSSGRKLPPSPSTMLRSRIPLYSTACPAPGQVAAQPQGDRPMKLHAAASIRGCCQ